jgi:hypothetical protein
MTDLNTISCPFCPFMDSDADFVSQHIEFCHPEGGDPFSSDLEPATQTSLPSDASTDNYIECPHGCGEVVTAAELSIHLDLHLAEDIALDDVGATPARTLARSPTFSQDDEYDNDLDMVDSYKGGKRGMQRDSARANTVKPSRPHSPPRTTNADGTKRLGVCFPCYANARPH